MLKNNTDIFAVCETNLYYLPIHHKDARSMHGLGVYVKSNLPIARDTIFEDVFSFGTSTFYYLHFFLYRSPSSSSYSVVEAVLSNIDKALILQPSANSMVCGDFSAHDTEWLCHSIPLMLQVCFVKSLLCQKTSPRLLISLLAFLTVMIISHIFLAYSFVLILTLALLLFRKI